MGFGVLEENVVYPALAVAYSMLFARKVIVSALCMFPSSILYAIVHNAYSKGAHQGIYAVEFGPQTITTLFKYWTYSVWPSKLDAFVVYDPHVATLLIGSFSLAILSFLVLRNWKEPAALFGMAWFLIAIGPYLLLPNRISAYYPVVPTIGLSLLAASAMQWGWRKSVVTRTVTLVLALSFAIPSSYAAWAECREARIRSQIVKNLVMSIDRLSDNQRTRHIFLQGIDDELFRQAIHNSPFRLLGLQHVYIAPSDAQKLTPWNEFKDYSALSPPESVVLQHLENGSGIVLRFENPRTANVTSFYRAVLRQRIKDNGFPQRIDPGDLLFQDYLKDGWHQIEDQHRWMSQQASFTISGKHGAGQALHIDAMCATEQQVDAPLLMTATISGKTIGQPIRIDRCDSEVDLSFPLPSPSEQIEVTLSLNKASKFPPDTRALGLVIRRIEIR